VRSKLHPDPHCPLAPLYAASVAQEIPFRSLAGQQSTEQPEEIQMHRFAIAIDVFALTFVAAFAAAPAGAQVAAAPALATLVAEALQNNPELRGAVKETEAAGQRIRPAGRWRTRWWRPACSTCRSSRCASTAKT
jgi:hypothetical protein